MDQELTLAQEPEPLDYINPETGQVEGKIICNQRVVLRTVDWDSLCKDQLDDGIGFRITEPGKSDVDERGGFYSIHSPLYGSDYDDENPYENLYRCRCKKNPMVGRKYADNHTICPVCHHPVEYVDLDLTVTGWIILDRDWIIQPEYYKKIRSFIGKHFDSIVVYVDPDKRKNDKAHPFDGIGMIELMERFSEVMDFYLKKNKKKLPAYLFIMSNISQVWAHCIPVYNKHLRGFYVTSTDVKYSKEDRLYKQIFSDHQSLNDQFALAKKQDRANKRTLAKIARGEDTTPKHGTVDYLRRENIIYHIQVALDALWDLGFKSIDKKTGIIQDQICGGRYDYTARTVIVPDPTLRQDEVGIGYLTFLELLKFQIVRYIMDLYDLPEPKAWDIWTDAKYEFDQHVYDIMNMMIKTRNLYVTDGRNPSINYGSAMGSKIVKVMPNMEDDNCMFISELILVKPNADFDGDIMYMNLHVVEKFGKAIYDAMNAADNFSISKNTGRIDPDMMPKKDLAVGWFAFNNM